MFLLVDSGALLFHMAGPLIDKIKGVTKDKIKGVTNMPPQGLPVDPAKAPLEGLVVAHAPRTHKSTPSGAFG